MIDFEHVSKQYKHNAKPALEDVNFHVDDGEFVFLLGHSGAGKSTLLKLILREALPTSGKVTVLGKDVAKLRRHKIPYLRRQMGIIFQDFRLIPSMTVYENVAFAMHVLNVPRREIRPRVEYILELVHLEDKAKCYPDTLSGGEQQRVAVARALVHNPKLVIADEPTGNIDPELSLEMMQLLERVSKMGITVLVVTHEHELVHRFHQRVVTLSHGRIISGGIIDVQKLVLDNCHRLVRKSIGPHQHRARNAVNFLRRCQNFLLFILEDIASPPFQILVPICPCFPLCSPQTNVIAPASA